MNEAITFSVSEFVTVFNQTLDYAYSDVVIRGEVANLSIRSNRLMYFDLKDDEARIELFGYVFMMNLPLENGMVVEVRGTPRLHPKYGFKINIKSIQLVGEGSIKKAADILKAKLEKEGIFNLDRKRIIPYPPESIGVITSVDSAAFSDFKKILSARFAGLKIYVMDVLVQGDKSSDMIVSAIKQFNAQAELVDVLVVIRGGGSSEDLQSFSSEQVTRAIAGSRIPTMVAIGHEKDLALAELAADQRASTPSNAAELLVPDKKELFNWLSQVVNNLDDHFFNRYNQEVKMIGEKLELLEGLVKESIDFKKQQIANIKQLIKAYDPYLPLKRGYAILKYDNKFVNNRTEYIKGHNLQIELLKKIINVKIESIKDKI